MRENEYWGKLLECEIFRSEIGVLKDTKIKEFKIKINSEPKFRLAVTMAVLQRFMANKRCLSTASNGGLNDRIQLFF